MDRIDAIRHRRSVRTFDGTPLRPEDAQRIMDFAREVGNPYELPIEWRLLDAKKSGLNSPVIAGTDAYIAGKMPRADHAEEAFGYAFERIVVFAETLGVGTTWIAGTMNRPAFEKAMGLAEGEVMPCVSPLGYPAAKKSLRETMMRKGIKADSRLDFTELFFEGDFDTPLTPEKAGELRLPLEMVRLAPSAVNKQPWRVVLSGGSAHFYEKRGGGFVGADGWDIQRIDMGIALCHFAIGAEENGLRGELALEDPGIPSNDGVTYVASYTLEA